MESVFKRLDVTDPLWVALEQTFSNFWEALTKNKAKNKTIFAEIFEEYSNNLIQDFATVLKPPLEKCIDKSFKLETDDTRDRGVAMNPVIRDSEENQDDSVELPNASVCEKHRDKVCIECGTDVEMKLLARSSLTTMTPGNGNFVENGIARLPKTLECEEPGDQFWSECGMDDVGLTPGKEEAETAPVGLMLLVFVTGDQDWTLHDMYVVGLTSCVFDPGGQASSKNSLGDSEIKIKIGRCMTCLLQG